MPKKVKILFIVLIILCVLFLAAGITLSVFFFDAQKRNQTYQSKINTMYEKSYYETVDNMTDIERKLGKVSVLSSSNLQQQFLYEIWRQCGISVSDLSQMAPEDENIEKVIKFLNQTGDYCYYLSRRAEGEMSEEEKQTLKSFKDILSDLNKELFSVQDKMVDGDMINADSLSDLTAIGEIVRTSSDVDYPELIYDGPFSDGLKDRTAVFLEGKQEKSEEQCRQYVSSVFPTATDIKLSGEGNSSVATYVFSFRLDGKEGTAQVSKKGGYLVDYNVYENITDPTFSTEQCIQNAGEFLQRAGYGDMQCVWSYNHNSTVYLNFAYTDNNFVCYPDLIKIKVSMQTGNVIGMEGQNYMYNHKQRTFPTLLFTATPPTGMENIARRYCVIPTEWGSELFCEEISGEIDGETYYIYYEIETGKEVEAFVVVDNLLV